MRPALADAWGGSIMLGLGFILYLGDGNCDGDGDGDDESVDDVCA